MWPRTIALKRARSRSMRPAPPSSPSMAASGRFLGRRARVAPGEEAADVVEHAPRAALAVAALAHQPRLDHEDLLLHVAVDDRAGAGRDLEGVAAVLEELELEGRAQPRVGHVGEALAARGEGLDVVHDLAAEVALAGLGHADLLLDAAHQAL